MDANDKINLIEEFSKLKNSHVIVLTTFNFDPFFFDGYILPVLEKYNRSAQIIVLVDEGQYNLAYPRFTNRTGIDYHLIPIRLNGGVFHPKFFLFTSKDKITTFVGSSNLSLQGFTNNAELVIKTQTKLEEGISIETKSIIDVLNGLVSKKLIHDNHILELISRISENLGSKTVISSPNFEILHNLETPIISQMLTKISEKTFDKLFVLAPFFSTDGKPLSEILSTLKIKNIEFGLQKQNHNLKNIENVQKITTSKGSTLTISSAQFLDTEVSEKEVVVPRRFHSKIIKLENSNKYLLAGSPNFTTEALLKTIDDGNFEFGLFFKNPNFDIMKQIRLDTSQGNSALNSVRKTNWKFPKKFEVSIISVYFDLVKRILHISCNPTSKILDIKIMIKEPKNTISKKIDFSPQIIDLPILEGIPIEIEIIGESSSFKRRIFDDTDPVKRLFRTGFSIRTLTENTNELLKIDKFALLDIIRQISDSSVNSTSNSSTFVPTSDSTHNHKYFPSLQSPPKNFISTLSSFSKLLDSIEIHKEKITKEEDFASNDEIEEISNTKLKEELNEESKNFKVFDKVLQKVFLILASYKKKNPNEDLIGIIVLYMKFFIEFSIQIFSINSAEDIQTLSDKNSFKMIVENFYKNLEEFFENASKEDLINSSANLLVITLLMSILSTKIIKNNNFLIGLHNVNFLNKKNYNEIRHYVQNEFKKLNLPLLKKDFDNYYSEYSYQFHQIQISKKIKSLIQTIVTEEDDAFRECLVMQLSKIHERYSNSTFKDVEYDKNTKSGKEIYSILGDYDDKHVWMSPW